ncbi:hypothetical protein PQR34_12835 [Paraburkholderia sediminicola]|uniref:hypothetical protein n=1 Tax=Paraburkholderia sediminicola TaxID=458836 RepID=UPI000E719291
MPAKTKADALRVAIGARVDAASKSIQVNCKQAWGQTASSLTEASEILDVSNRLSEVCDQATTELATVSEANLPAFIATLGKGLSEATPVPNDDRKTAATLTAELPKLFITMALAVIAALSILLQLGWNTFVKDNTAAIFCGVFSALLAFFSMVSGVRAIRDLAYSGLRYLNRWNVSEATRKKLNRQAWLGISSILFFLATIILAQNRPTSADLLVTLPANFSSTGSKSVSLTGTWSRMQMIDSNGTKVEFPPIASGASATIVVRSAK